VFQRQHQTIQIPRQALRGGLVALVRAPQQEARGFRDAPLGDAHHLREAVPVFVARSDQNIEKALETEAREGEENV
jgi:hypothetical protein